MRRAGLDLPPAHESEPLLPIASPPFFECSPGEVATPGGAGANWTCVGAPCAAEARTSSTFIEPRTEAEGAPSARLVADAAEPRQLSTSDWWGRTRDDDWREARDARRDMRDEVLLRRAHEARMVPLQGASLRLDPATSGLRCRHQLQCP